MFKVNISKDTRKTSTTFCVFIAKFEHKSHLVQCYCYYLWTDKCRLRTYKPHKGDLHFYDYISVKTLYIKSLIMKYLFWKVFHAKVEINCKKLQKSWHLHKTWEKSNISQILEFQNAIPRAKNRISKENFQKFGKYFYKSESL